MSLIDWLRRLGILRFGAEGAVYHNATERPASLQMDGVFDSRKDVVDLNERRSSAPSVTDDAS
ncbi:MAG: hypothetical protein GXX96_14700 [Planctomycetaceae bacterium]|jgi:hypothetical protein|nr:hypothetical protein [Planctomycetaceae bacterium]